jgi:phytoene dehydrogenase-like protein
MSATQDALVIGAGHNGLAAAALLARGGLATLVVEGSERIGGAALTEEFHPGFRVSSLAHLAGPLRPGLVRELGLKLDRIEPEPRLFAPLGSEAGLALHGDPGRSAEAIRPFSARDAERWPAFCRSLEHLAGLLERVIDAPPPDVNGPGPADLLSLLRLGLGYRGLGREDAYRLLRWIPMSLADFTEEWFESEPLRAIVAARGLKGSFAGPMSAGTTANLLLGAAQDGGGGAGRTVLVRGGLGAVGDALADAARSAGARIRTGSRVSRILARNGRAAGVVLEGGEEIPARCVVSATDPKRTVLELLDPPLVDPDERRRMRGFRIRGMCSKVHLALGELPRFAGAAPGSLQGRLHFGPTVEALERAFDTAHFGGIPERPWLEVTLPSLTDPGLAPQGKHVLSAYVQYTPWELAGTDWESQREHLGERVIDVLEECAPGLRRSIEGSQVLTPEDLERRYALTGGHPLHGEPALDQLYAMRPLLGWGRYRGPIPGLYLCSAGTHPGGGVTGAPGANAARAVLSDRR